MPQPIQMPVTRDIMGVITEISSTSIVRPRSRDADSLKGTLQICDAYNSTLPVTLWGDRSTAFDAEKIYKDGQTKPQVVVFVGTLIRDYAGIGLTITGSSPCKWYINLDIPDVLKLKESFSVNFQPIWVENAAPAFNQDTPEEKTIKEILKLNPHKYKRARFIVNVTIKSIHDENCWWYNSCDRCCRTSKPYGSTYRCSSCCYIGMPVPRYKVVLTAADNTSEAAFVLFGRIAHRLIHRPVESLIEENPPDFIPAEIQALVDQAFVWNVSFTEHTVKRNQESLQVNSIVSSGAPKQHFLPISPSTSGGTSTIVPLSPGTSLQTPPAASESSIESRSSTRGKQSASLQPSLSTPTKYVVSAAADDTPTSKSNPSGSTKKKYVVLAYPMQSQTMQPSIDDKATTEPKSGQKTLEHPSLPAAGPSESESEHKIKGTFVNTPDDPPISPSVPSKSASKKRTNTIASVPAPPAKKLFKEHSQHTKDQSE
ncbi:uncharacterized protein LOC127776138 isoform X2 [Oryza glaberrima]|uniref:uncharacterized protein LOC127776138 isoform X2 n=1 Tax=Oryza glaberrima TaxID=4538 RepID=UPI00224C4FC0|nr:uncharacterized protein LOC127776138 isoform X2 [Oryza glaberrima]